VECYFREAIITHRVDVRNTCRSRTSSAGSLAARICEEGEWCAQ
jgi:hypothetical protein